MPEKTHFLSLLFLDVPTALQVRDRRGNDAAADFLADVMARLGRILQQHGGHEVRSVASTMLSYFDDASKALRAACEMRQVMNNSRVSGVRPRLRIGLHAGEVTVHGRSFYGEAVSTSARLVTLCAPGQILLTKVFLELLDPVDMTSFQTVESPREWATAVGELFQVLSDEGTKAGVSPEEVRQTLSAAARTNTRPLEPDGSSAGTRFKLTQLQRKSVASQAAEDASSTDAGGDREGARLCLIRGRSIMIVDSGNTAVSIGREEGNDIVLDLTTASRRHAHVELRRTGFFLVDHSWNGTFVYDENGEESHVHNAEHRLEDSGIICPGSPGSADEVEAIRFIEAR